MTAEEIASVTLEHLRAIRATQADHGDELAAIRLELSAMGNSLGHRPPPSIPASPNWTASSAAWSASSGGWS